MKETYPYYVEPYLEALKEAEPGSRRQRVLKERIMANIGDEATLKRLIGQSDAAATSPEETTAPNHSADSPRNLETTDWKILVKNREYEKALQIIELRNLNNPKKNIYFADQIRFLKKLIALQATKQGKQER